MPKNLIKAALVGGLIAFAWGFISWVALPFHMDNIKSFKSDIQVAEVLMHNTNSPGIYAMPSMEKKDSSVNVIGTMPFAFVSFRPKGYEESPRMMVISLVMNIFVAFMIGFLLSRAKGLEYSCRVKFVTMIGLIAAVLSYVPEMNWWGFDLQYCLLGMADAVIAWLLAGFAMAKMIEAK